MFKVATWNVNSLPVRLPHVLDWLREQQPDILAVQETKTPDPKFPRQVLQEAGYQVLFAGQNTYNGVALLSRQPGHEVVTDLPDLNDPQRRVLGATYGDIRILNLYVPNGEALTSEKYPYKLNWLNHLQAYVQTNLARYPRFLVVGDFNIAPTDADVDEPALWAGGVIVSPAERQALQGLYALGLQDTFRLFTQPAKSFSWWDYRAGAFRRNHGLRIDLILASPALATCCTTCVVDVAPRRLERPSDHAPVVATFNI
ncbi:MAG: exodeoxyribonuclease III [Beggiatoa sp. IS2]|nr:MAG: exodeoxyribonuclease III [Beggiatoa sp. IS2]